MEKSVEEWYEENAPIGFQLGYPECCIKAFCNQSPSHLRSKDFHPNKEDYQRYQAACIDGKYTGFIPCADHAKKILAKEITLESLIKDRNPEFAPFPEWGIVWGEDF